ncbi:MAG: uncharacterized protein JWO31_1663 [Phycisphaerales bacterium]|nr:uncharacterized protein [Phycisphaerales bacterium]
MLAGVLLAAAGCGSTGASSAPLATYGRESQAIAAARQRSAENDRQKAIDARQESDRKAAEQQREIDRRVAERVAQPTPVATTPSAVTTPPVAAPPAAGQVKHVVVVWLKSPGDKAARQKVLDSAAALRTIPGVLDVAGGECLPSDRAVVDSTYDVALVITLADAAALKAYGPHPTHQKVLAEVLKPAAERYVVYDFVAR